MIMIKIDTQIYRFYGITTCYSEYEWIKIDFQYQLYA